MQIATTERTRLFVEGVPRAITAEVTNRRDDGLVVTQALPFLRLATAVRGDDGQRCRISRVTIAMDGDVPKLLLELRHDEEPRLSEPVLDGPVPDEPRRPAPFIDARPLAAPIADAPPIASSVVDDDTVQTFTPGVSSRPARTDGTVPYEFQADIRSSREVPIGVATIGPPVEPPPRLPAPELPLWLRLWRGVGRLWSSLVRRHLPALPSGG